MKKLDIKIVFTEEVLGTSPANKEIYRDFIGSKSPDAATIEEEVAALGEEATVEKQMTIFPKDEEGRPFIYDYQIKGFFKDACSMLARVGGKDENGKKIAANESGKLKAYKKEIDGLIFVQPRQIPITFDGEIGYCERPLRAQTPQGERVALSISEAIPAGASAEFSVICMRDDQINAVLEWFDYGVLRGLGQWRNSGKGRFEYTINTATAE